MFICLIRNVDVFALRWIFFDLFPPFGRHSVCRVNRRRRLGRKEAGSRTRKIDVNEANVRGFICYQPLVSLASFSLSGNLWPPINVMNQTFGAGCRVIKTRKTR